MESTRKARTVRLTATACLCAAVSLSSAYAKSSEATKWTWTGWGGGGYFWSAVIDPSNADVMYLGGDVDGLYKSTDHGKSWFFINNGVNDYGMYGLAISKSSPKTLYAMSLNGIVKTVNGGELWTPLAKTLRTDMHLSAKRYASVRPVAVHPSDPEWVYAGSGTGAAYMTRDGGKNWTPLDYLSAISKAAPASAVAPASGTGFLWAKLEIPANNWKDHGRLERYYSQADDWTGYDKLSASIYTPAGAPELKVSLVVQSGTGWKWQNSDATLTKSGDWTTVSFDLSGIETISQIQMVHIMIRSDGKAFNGEIGVDAVRIAGASKPERQIGEWDASGSKQEWRISKSADAPFVKGFRTSLDSPVAEAGPIASVVLSEADPKTVFICHRTLGLFRSVDAGKTWKQLDTPKNASHVAVSLSSPKTVYGAFEKDGVWKSTDGGDTWNKISDGVSAEFACRELAVHPKRPDVVHMIANRSWAGTYMRSEDGGRTWTANRSFRRDLVGNPTEPDGHSGGFKELSSTTNLAMSPSDPDTLFISANWNNVVTTDGGKSWNESSRGADITCFHDLRFVDGTVFGVAMDEGLFSSADNGATWKQHWPKQYTAGESGHHWRVAAFKRPDGQFHIVSTVSPWRGAEIYPNHIVVSKDSGKTFTRATGLPNYLPSKNTMWESGYARALAADPQNPETLYLGIDGDPDPAKGNAGGGIFKSTDGGLSWKQLPNQPGSRRMFYALAVDPTDSKRIFWGAHSANGGVWRSEDGGESWSHMTGPDSYLFNLEVTNDGTVYAGGNELWKSTDHGTTWKKISNIPNRGGSIVGIAWDPENANRVWFSNVTWDGSSVGGIYRSDNGGKSWVEITGDIGYRKPLVLRYNSKTKELWAAGVAAFRTKQ